MQLQGFRLNCGVTEAPGVTNVDTQCLFSHSFHIWKVLVSQVADGPDLYFYLENKVVYKALQTHTHTHTHKHKHSHVLMVTALPAKL